MEEKEEAMKIGNKYYCGLCFRWMKDAKPRDGNNKKYCCDICSDIATTRRNNMSRIGVKYEMRKM